MRHFAKLLLAAGLAFGLTATPAFAHAFLDHATPAVGGSVQGGPGELKLTFTEDIVIAFSGVSLHSDGGAAIPLGKPSVGPANTLSVHIARKLAPGTYVVSWHVVSVDTHHTQGTYKFTVQ